MTIEVKAPRETTLAGMSTKVLQDRLREMIEEQEYWRKVYHPPKQETPVQDLTPKPDHW